MYCEETRHRGGGVTYRRYLCECGEKTSTHEINSDELRVLKEKADKLIHLKKFFLKDC